MAKHTAVNGEQFTDDDIERWGAEAEAGFTEWEFGKSVAGRPISVGAEARPFTVRLDAERRAKLAEAAEKQHISPSQLMRNLIDAL